MVLLEKCKIIGFNLNNPNPIFKVVRKLDDAHIVDLFKFNTD